VQGGSVLQQLSPARWIRQINWRREALYLSCVGMEICILVPWYLVLRVQAALLQGGRPAVLAVTPHISPVPIAATVGLLLAILVLGLRGLFALDLPLAKQQAILAVLILATWLLALRLTLGGGQPWWSLRWLPDSLYEMTHAARMMPPALLTTIGVMVLWWRGVSLAQRNLTLGSVSFAFRLGVLILIGGVAAMALYEPAWGPPFVVAYFFYSLLAVSLARVEEMAGEGGTVGPTSSGRWLVILALASAGLIGLGLLASSLYSLEGIRQVLMWLRPLWRFLGGILYVLLSWIARLLEPLMLWLVELVQGAFASFGGQEITPFEFPVFEPPPVTEASGVQRVVGETLRYVCPGAIFLLALLAILFIFPARRRRSQHGEGSSESLLSAQDLLDGAADALKKGAQRLQELGRMVGQYGVGRTLFKALTVRRVYAQMCRVAGERGYPRDASQTPHEYLQILPQAFPGREEEVQSITEAYEQVHYGETPATPEQLDEVQASWQRLQATPPPIHHPSPDSR